MAPPCGLFSVIHVYMENISSVIVHVTVCVYIVCCYKDRPDPFR